MMRADALKIRANRLAATRKSACESQARLERTRKEVAKDCCEEEYLAADPDDGAELDVRVVETSRKGLVEDGELREHKIGGRLRVGGDKRRPGGGAPEGTVGRRWGSGGEPELLPLVAYTLRGFGSA